MACENKRGISINSVAASWRKSWRSENGGIGISIKQKAKRRIAMARHHARSAGIKSGGMVASNSVKTSA